MDHHRFDRLTRTFASESSRRTTLKAVAGGALAAVFGAKVATSAAAQDVVADACMSLGQRCRRNAECCSRFCPRARGADRCTCRPTDMRCRNRSECCSGVCTDNRCE